MPRPAPPDPAQIAPPAPGTGGAGRGVRFTTYAVVDRKSATFALTAGTVLVLAGLLLGIAAVRSFLDGRALLRDGAVAEGVVTRIQPHGTRGGTLEPVFGFRTAAGEWVEVARGWGSNPVEWAEGERVTMRYDPAAPSRAIPDTSVGAWADLAWKGSTALLLLPTGLILLAALARFLLGRTRAGRAPGA